MARLDIALLGPLSVSLDGHELEMRGAKPRALLAALALHRESVVPVGVLVTYLWDEPIPERAEHTLQQHVSSLRKIVEPGRRSPTTAERLVTRDPGYLLHVDALDVDEFESGSTRGADAYERGDLDTALIELNGAMARIRDRPLADVRSSMRLEAAAIRLEERVHATAEIRVDILLARGAHQEAIVLLEPMIEQQPYRENLRAQLMLALYRSHRQTEALGVFRATRALMVEQLGVEPGRSLRELEEAILRQDPSLDHGVIPRNQVSSTFRADESPDYGWIELPDGQVIALAGPIVVGRGPDTDVRLVDSRVSREHARIELRDDGPYVVDLGSTNGTSVNEVRVDDRPLVDGDAVSLGGVVLRYRASTPTAIGPG